METAVLTGRFLAGVKAGKCKLCGRLMHGPKFEQCTHACPHKNGIDESMKWPGATDEQIAERMKADNG